MSDCSESWDSASLDEIKLSKVEKRMRTSTLESKIKILHQFLLVIEALRKERDCFLVDGINEYDKLEKLKKEPVYGQKLHFTGLFSGIKTKKINFNTHIDTQISFFVNLNKNNIPCRIYFVLGKEIEAFLEYSLNKTIVKNKCCYNGLCFSVDFNSHIADQTLFFSKKCSYHHFFMRILAKIKNKSYFADSNPIPIFEELDAAKFKAIPSNISKIKIHPLYITEDCCRFNEAIYPKRPILGYFKGKPLYPRNNLIRLRTEGGWYLQGRSLKANDNGELKPFRIHKGKRLFAEFQTKSIEVATLTGNPMDAFHPNFTPKDCVYIDEDPQIAIDLGIPYSDCYTGFRGKEKIMQGFFLEKKWAFLVEHFIKEKLYYELIFERIEFHRKSAEEWKTFLKKYKKLSKINKSIGL